MIAKTIYVLESSYGAPRGGQTAGAMRFLLAFESVTTLDPSMLLRAVEV